MEREGKASIGGGCSCRNGYHRGTSSRGEGGCARDAPTASSGFLLSSPRLSVLLLPAITRWKEITSAVSLNSFLFLSSTQLKNYETRPKSQRAQKYQLGLRGGPTLPYIGLTSGLREGGAT